MRGIRLRFTITNLFLLTVIAALGATLYNSHLRFQKLRAELALHRAVRAQAERVGQREQELRAVEQQSTPDVLAADLYRWVGKGEQLPTDAAAAAARLGLDLSMPLGFRRNRAAVNNARLQLRKEKAVLRNIQHDLAHQTQDSQFSRP